MMRKGRLAGLPVTDTDKTRSLVRSLCILGMRGGMNGSEEDG